jgi:hypothetical protein
MTAAPLQPIQVTDRTGRTGQVIAFYEAPPAVLIVWDGGNATRLPASKFADLTAVTV